MHLKYMTSFSIHLNLAKKKIKRLLSRREGTIVNIYSSVATDFKCYICMSLHDQGASLVETSQGNWDQEIKQHGNVWNKHRQIFTLHPQDKMSTCFLNISSFTHQLQHFCPIPGSPWQWQGYYFSLNWLFCAFIKSETVLSEYQDGMDGDDQTKLVEKTAMFLNC